MSQNIVVSGNVPRDWNWRVAKTPEQWWIDYSEKNPAFNPYELDANEFFRIYDGKKGREFTDLLEERKFMINHFGNDFKVELDMAGYSNQSQISYEEDLDNYHAAYERARFLRKTSEFKAVSDMVKFGLTPGAIERRLSTYYNPMAEAPNLYLKFCRLSSLLLEKPAKVINEVLKFVKKYGPPWYPESNKFYSPPFDNPPDCPLTIDGILWQSFYMDSVVQAYRLLTDISDNINAGRELKKHMAKLQKQGIASELDPLPLGKSGYISMEKPILIQQRFHPKSEIKYQDLNDKEVAQTAIALIMSSVNDYLEIVLGIATKIGEDGMTGAWVPQYKYNSLLGAMWLQFFFDITNNGQLRECANQNCRTLFRVTRSDKEYCCKECKIKQYMRDHHKNKEEKL
jgi:hypothetical protein